jgi:hypothetical protein
VRLRWNLSKGRRQRRVEVRCRRCGAVAACFELLDPGTHSDFLPNTLAGNADAATLAGIEVERWCSAADRIVCTGFSPGIESYFGPRSKLADLFDQIDAGGFARIRSADVALARAITFHCAKCNAAYCHACWQLGSELSADADHFALGSCPVGHQQPLAR